MPGFSDDATNQLGIDFVATDLSLAHTFLDVAETTTRVEQRRQSLEDARTAYRTVLRFIPRLQLTTAQRTDLEQQVSALMERLILAGVEL